MESLQKQSQQEELFRSVEVPAGEHRIVWTYHPVSFKVGGRLQPADTVVAGGNRPYSFSGIRVVSHGWIDHK